jgi:hypothetical protein
MPLIADSWFRLTQCRDEGLVPVVLNSCEAWLVISASQVHQLSAILLAFASIGRLALLTGLVIGMILARSGFGIFRLAGFHGVRHWHFLLRMMRRRPNKALSVSFLVFTSALKYRVAQTA